MVKPTLSLMALAGVLSACTSAVEPISSVSSAMLKATDCSAQGCGANAATVGDGIVFDQVDGSGQVADASGLRLQYARAMDGRPVSVAAVGDHLVATAVDNQNVTYEDQQLMNLVLHFVHDNGAEYEIRINHIGITSFWTVRPGDIPIYELLVWKTHKADPTLYQGPLPESEPDLVTDPGRPICTGKNFDTDAEKNALPFGALTFEGDQFDDDKKTVTTPPVSTTPPGLRWFNLACIGTSMAKMHFLRHTSAGSYSDNGLLHTTTLDQRQAMLKMLTADYCGDGHSFTVNGRPLAYQDSMNWYTLYPVDLNNPKAFEAIWGPNGAVCLNQPRLATVTVPEVQNYCMSVKHPTIPTCTRDMEVSWRKFGHVASSNAVMPAP